MTPTRLIPILFLLSFSMVAAEPPASIPLWPNGAPGSEARKDEKEVVAPGKITNIHNPSIIPYLPSKEKATGVAVIVCPGGGHSNLAIDHEGYNVGEWLRERGIAAFVLKYRLAREPGSTYKIDVDALADGQRAMRLVRSRAAEWNIRPDAVGMIGFSAGGEVVWLTSSRFDSGHADSSDPVEKQDSKPSFQALIYPGSSRTIQPTKESPPVFLACGYNDRPDISEGLATVYLNFKKAGVPAELHIYAGAGHGFGLRATNTSPAGSWPERFQEWLADRKFLTKP